MYFFILICGVFSGTKLPGNETSGTKLPGTKLPGTKLPGFLYDYGSMSIFNLTFATKSQFVFKLNDVLRNVKFSEYVVNDLLYSYYGAISHIIKPLDRISGPRNNFQLGGPPDV